MKSADSNENTLVFRPVFLEKFDLPLGNVTYVTAMFYRIEKNVEVVNAPIWIGVANCLAMVVRVSKRF